MCGRYRLSRRKQIIEEYFETAPWDDDWNPRYNVAPTQPEPVIRQHPKEPARHIPHWAKAPPVAMGTINAKSETDMVRWWFNQNLERPTRFTASRAPFYRKKSRALSWFKETATEHLARVQDLVAILENHGVPVRTLKAKRVGYVVYEDEYQIVAEPFAHTEC